MITAFLLFVPLGPACTAPVGLLALHPTVVAGPWPFAMVSLWSILVHERGTCDSGGTRPGPPLKRSRMLREGTGLWGQGSTPAIRFVYNRGREVHMKVQPMLQVEDVEAASSWYQAALGLVSGHGGPEYEMLFAGEPHTTPLLLQLHRWNAHEHGFFGDADQPRGNGCSLWFVVDDRAELDAVWARMQAVGAHVLEAPHWNPLAHHWEFAVRDPQGYVMIVASTYQPEG